MRLGVHVSIAGKIYESIDRVKALGCDTMQIFSRNPREWKATPIPPEDALEFRKRLKASRIAPLIIHVPYLTNLASPDKRLFHNSIRYNCEYLKEAGQLNADYLVTHMGSHKKSGEREGLSRVSEALNKIFTKTRGIKTAVLLENTSGSGSWLGYKFWHIKQILDNLDDEKKAGICLDTCHAFAAGYDLSTAQGLDSMLNEIEALVGLDKLKAVHLNDSKDDLGSRHDRHEHIGKGKIGLEGFRNIVNHPGLRDLPFILETPKTGESDDKRNLKTVRALWFKKE